MPQQYIDFGYVKENASFEQVIACYKLKLLGSGKDRSVLCPFHDERKPSCKIELERKIFHCFGCDVKGNVLEFVARIEGSLNDLRAAAFTLAGICKIPVAAPRGQGRKAAPGRPERQGAPTAQKTGEGAQSGAEGRSVAPGGANNPAAPLRAEARSGAPVS